MSECIVPSEGTQTFRGYIRLSGPPRVFAHRKAWENAHGPVPAGKVLHHDCENKACMNIEHLRLMTQAEHMAWHMAERQKLGCSKCGGRLRVERNGPSLALRCEDCRRGSRRKK